MAAALLLVIGMGVLPGSERHARAEARPWLNSAQSPERRAAELLAAMTRDEKLTMLHGGAPCGYVGCVDGNRRLGIPALHLQDGPVGAGNGLRDVTRMAAPVAGAASWDTELMRRYGEVLGSEQWGKGTNVVLAPTINIVRDPRWGRAFESLGEDPYLAGELGAADIRGIQSQGPMAQVKHFVVYNQETHRNTAADNAVVSERAVREIYTPAFEAAVTRGHADSAMCSYSAVNGPFACENGPLQNGLLKGDLGFTGFITSDWEATHSTVASAEGGLDMEMPGRTFYGRALTEAVRSGRVSQATIDDHTRRILVAMFRRGLFDRPPTGSRHAVVASPAHAAVSRQVAEEGSVLLKNARSVLPVSPAVRSIAVIGDDAGPGVLSQGGGSSGVHAPHLVTPYRGIRSRAGHGVTVTYAPGVPPANGPRPAGAGSYPTAGGGTDRARRESVRSSHDRAVATARAADLAVVFVGLLQTERRDLRTIDLSAEQNRLVADVAAANPNTVVVVNSGSAVTMPWAGAVRGIVENWYPGQEAGHAIAALLFGDVNFSGKLPVTFPASLADVPAHTGERWPGRDGTVRYDEGLDVGYRWYDSRRKTPMYPFGYGLSYTTFGYSGLTVSAPDASGEVTVGFDVTNTGTRAGAEVAQVYVGQPSWTGEPPKNLRGFQRVTLAPGRTRHLTVTLAARSFQFWRDGWTTAAGTHTVYVGASSRDIRLAATTTVPRGTGGTS